MHPPSLKSFCAPPSRKTCCVLPFPRYAFSLRRPPTLLLPACNTHQETTFSTCTPPRLHVPPRCSNSSATRLPLTYTGAYGYRIWLPRVLLPLLLRFLLFQQFLSFLFPAFYRTASCQPPPPQPVLGLSKRRLGNFTTPRLRRSPLGRPCRWRQSYPPPSHPLRSPASYFALCSVVQRSDLVQRRAHPTVQWRLPLFDAPHPHRVARVQCGGSSDFSDVPRSGVEQ